MCNNIQVHLYIHNVHLTIHHPNLQCTLLSHTVLNVLGFFQILGLHQETLNEDKLSHTLQNLSFLPAKGKVGHINQLSHTKLHLLQVMGNQQK